MTATQTTQTTPAVQESKSLKVNIDKVLEQQLKTGYVKLPEDYKISLHFMILEIEKLNDIDKVDRTDIAKAIIDVMDTGLDFRKKHFYFFVQNDKNAKSGKSLRYNTQYQGKVFKAKMDLNVKDVRPVLVHENDEIILNMQDGNLVVEKHAPTFKGDVVGGYCVVLYNDGEKKTSYFTMERLEQRRNASQSPNGNFWKWSTEMYEKTLINATMTRLLETSPEVGDIGTEYINEDFAEYEEVRKVEDDNVIDQSDPLAEAPETPAKEAKATKKLTDI